MEKLLETKDEVIKDSESKIHKLQEKLKEVEETNIFTEIVLKESEKRHQELNEELVKRKKDNLNETALISELARKHENKVEELENNVEDLELKVWGEKEYRFQFSLVLTVQVVTP